MAERILVVDDDPETLRLIGIMLERQGFDVTTVDNGPLALRLSQEKPPDMIVLDIMMPEIDGYEVARQLRSSSITSNIPILMFTAKTQVEEKVTGYEAGADDYLTKPTHPTELVARIRGLLAKGKIRTNTGPLKLPKKGYLVGIIAPHGGMGTSSLTMNLALAIHKKHKVEVIAVELQPGHGTWAQELGLSDSSGLNNLLSKNPEEISMDRIEEELTLTSFGVRLLVSSYSLKDAKFASKTSQLRSLVQRLPYFEGLTLVDLGTGLIPAIDDMVTDFNEMIVLTEPYPNTVKLTRMLVNELKEKGFGKSRFLQVVLHNRIRSDMQLSISQIEELLGKQVSFSVTPQPELAYQAAMKNVPLLQIQPESLLNKQVNQIADSLAQRLTTSKS